MPRAEACPRVRIVVHLGGASPELARALAATPARARAERLRQLALLGLVSLGSTGASEARSPSAPAGTETTRDARRRRLLGTLRAGLDGGSQP